MIDQNEILKVLDDAARNGDFPTLDHPYYYHGDQRLSIFANTNRWVILIEIFAFNNHHYDLDGLMTIAHYFGNHLKPHNPVFGFFSDFDENFFTTDERGVPELTKTVKKVTLRGKQIDINHDVERYYAKSIELENVPSISAWEFMRGLVPEERDGYLLRPVEMYLNIPSDLKMIMQLYDWYHPDMAASELPSATTTFQELAQVIVALDPTRFNNKGIQNTHWSNWPEGGSL
jgi:hypothetical protein